MMLEFGLAEVLTEGGIRKSKFKILHLLLKRLHKIPIRSQTQTRRFWHVYHPINHLNFFIHQIIHHRIAAQ